MAQLDLIATMAFGLESVVADELGALGYKSKTLGNGRVHFHAEPSAIARANLWLRAADRVLIRLGIFPATDFGQLFDGIRGLPWEAWLPAYASFPVKGRSVKSQLSSVPACQKIAKKAIVERLRDAHRVQTLPETGSLYTIEVALLNDQATLTLDTTGPGLNKRGYRTLVGEAQLKETLAAAMLMLSGWRAEQSLVDPFCGTGTIPIEAALIGRNMAPGIHREFAAEHWPALDNRIWSEAREEARDSAQPRLPERIVASDIDEGALRQARYHARQAGVEEDIHFQPREFTELSSSKRHGLLLCNPPYGERLATQREAEMLYRAMPAVFNRLPSWSYGILTSHAKLERLVGRKSDSRRKLYNGRIECWFYQFRGPAADERAAGPMFRELDDRALDRYRKVLPLPLAEDRGEGGRDTTVPIPVKPADSLPRQQEEFTNRLSKVARHLRKWPQRGVTCYRLYERDIPEIPLIIDRYEDCLHIVERPRPHERTLNEHHRWLETIAATAAETLSIDPAHVFLNRYSDRRGLLSESATAAPTQVVQENRLKFHVNLRDFRDTGLPLDLRNLRSTLQKQATGKRLLSLNGNTGTLAIAAAAGGAASSLTVDPTATHLEWTRQSLLLNGFSENVHQIAAASPADYLAAPAGDRFDFITIEDPTPADTTGDASASTFQREHSGLLSACLLRLATDGVIYLISHDRRFRLASDELPALHIREITVQTLPEDFRNRRIHRVWRITPAKPSE